MSAFVDELEERGLLEAATDACKPLGLRVDDLKQKTRAPVIVEARARFARYLREEKKWSAPMVARLLEIDRGTVYAMLGQTAQKAEAAERRGKRFGGRGKA